MIQISLIAAVADNNAIGFKNQLLSYIPEDLQRFKRITSGHTVIMGRKTWDSLKIKPLPNRKNIIITGSNLILPNRAFLAHSIEDTLVQCDQEKENFIIGGETIYRVFISIAQKLYITRIYSTFEADTYFPDIDNSWILIDKEAGISSKSIPFKFEYLTYCKKN